MQHIDFESVWIEIKNKNSKNIACVVFIDMLVIRIVMTYQNSYIS